MKNSRVQVEKEKRCTRPVVCFEGEVRQVLSNLISKAIDAIPGSGGCLLLHSRSAHEWSTGCAGLVVTVADTGSGMDSATLKKVFDPFFSTKGSGGTGLGLGSAVRSSCDIVGLRGFLEHDLRTKSPPEAAVLSPAILKAGGSRQILASFDLQGALKFSVRESERELSSPNVLAVLPGSDPTLKAQYVVVAAHLDGYGFGTSVMGDALYNGALDDAAYVALLIQFADNLHAHPTPLKRSILFCAFTGEEKGLLGSRYFVAHPTVPIAQLAADINLDQLRPLFPLRELTALAVDDTTLGQTAKDVATPMGIKIKPDSEPERSLLQRADHYPFLQAGVPAIGFIFGYEPGTDAERRYREWYHTRYHRPQDDVTQPLDFDAAAKFDRFFYALTEAVASDPNRPAIKRGSHFSHR